MNSKEKAVQTLVIRDIGKFEYPPCQWSYEIAQDYLGLIGKMEGHVLVPVEPTKEDMDKFFKAWFDDKWGLHEDSLFSKKRLSSSIQAMIGATNDN